jgi:hypothetical protein
MNENVDAIIEIVPKQLFVAATRPGTEPHEAFSAKTYMQFYVRLIRVRDATLIKSKKYEFAFGVPQDSNYRKIYNVATNVPEDLLKAICEYPVNQVIEDFLAPIVAVRPN